MRSTTPTLTASALALTVQQPTREHPGLLVLGNSLAPQESEVCNSAANSTSRSEQRVIHRGLNPSPPKPYPGNGGLGHLRCTMAAMRLSLRILALALLTTSTLSSVDSSLAQPTKDLTGSSAQAGELSEQLSAEARADLASGRFAEAEAVLVRLSSLNPGVPEIHANLGAVYFQEGKIRAAADSLRRALRLKPTLSKSKTLLAICLAELGESKQQLPGLDSFFHLPADLELKRSCGLV